MKSAFTRAYNKVAHLTPYSLQMAPKTKRVASVDADVNEELESNEAEAEQGSLESDAMIKVAPPSHSAFKYADLRAILS